MVGIHRASLRPSILIKGKTILTAGCCYVERGLGDDDAEGDAAKGCTTGSYHTYAITRTLLDIKPLPIAEARPDYVMRSSWQHISIYPWHAHYSSTPRHPETCSNQAWHLRHCSNTRPQSPRPLRNLLGLLYTRKVASHFISLDCQTQERIVPVRIKPTVCLRKESTSIEAVCYAFVKANTEC